MREPVQIKLNGKMQRKCNLTFCTLRAAATVERTMPALSVLFWQIVLELQLDV